MLLQSFTTAKFPIFLNRYFMAFRNYYLIYQNYDITFVHMYARNAILDTYGLMFTL